MQKYGISADNSLLFQAVDAAGTAGLVRLICWAISFTGIRAFFCINWMIFRSSSSMCDLLADSALFNAHKKIK